MYLHKTPKQELEKIIFLAEDQYFIREEMKKQDIAAFIADGSHQFIPYHKICSGCIFIDEQKFTSRLDSFYYISRLGSTSAGIQRTESFGIFSVRKMVDKKGNICIRNFSSIFCTKF